MKQYKAILTHNPQDYFEGNEPDELVLEMYIYEHYPEPQTKQCLFEAMLQLIDEGYKAIIVPIEGDDSG